jgi:hypothetical protein
MSGRFQSSLDVETTSTMTIATPTGGPLHTLTIAAGHKDTTDDVLADLEAQAEAATGVGWTLSVNSSGHVVWTLDAGGSFDLRWTTVWLRDWLGWAANVINASGSATAPERHLGGLYTSRTPRAGILAQEGTTGCKATAVPSLSGAANAAALSRSSTLSRMIVVALTRDSGDWTEFRQLEEFLGHVGDGREFSVGTEPGTWLAVVRLRGPEEIVYRREVLQFFDHYSASLDVVEAR